MTADHDPLCPFDEALANYKDRDERTRLIVADMLVTFGVCICDRLRACEARVRADERAKARQRVEAARHRGPQDERPEYHYIFATDPAAAAGGDA